MLGFVEAGQVAFLCAVRALQVRIAGAVVRRAGVWLGMLLLLPAKLGTAFGGWGAL